MNTKKKTIPKEESATQARPGMLAMVVIVAGAASSWYWYKPLSNDLSQDPQADASASSFFGSQQTLIEPNTNAVVGSNGGIVPVYSALPEDLVGDRQVELRPFQPTPQGTLQERLSKEPLPVIPISRPDRSRSDAKSSIASGPAIWTNPQSPPTGPSDSTLGTLAASSNQWDSASPFSGNDPSARKNVATDSNARLMGDRIVTIPSTKNLSNPWPDKQFDPGAAVPQGMAAKAPQAHENPPLRMNSPGKIVLTESRVEETGSAMERKSIQASWSSVPSMETGSAATGSTVNVKKSGAVIRQPKH
jgi:hypothetical protein